MCSTESAQPSADLTEIVTEPDFSGLPDLTHYSIFSILLADAIHGSDAQYLTHLNLFSFFFQIEEFCHPSSQF